MYSLVSQLEAERKKYGDTMTGDECVELLNAVLWNDPRKGYKLVEKKRGANGKRSDGALCSRDGLVWWQDGTFVDVLRDAGGVSQPTWQVHAIGKVNPKTGNIHKPHTGKLIDAIEPKSAVDPSPNPEPDPIQPVEPQMPDYAEAIDILIGKLTTLESKLAVLEGRVTVAERQWKVPGEILLRLEAVEKAEYKVVQDNEAEPLGTSRDLYHGHQLRVRVDRVK